MSEEKLFKTWDQNKLIRAVSTVRKSKWGLRRLQNCLMFSIHLLGGMSTYKDWCYKDCSETKNNVRLFATFTFSNYTVISENNYEKWAILNKCIGYTHVLLLLLLIWVYLLSKYF